MSTLQAGVTRFIVSREYESDWNVDGYKYLLKVGDEVTYVGLEYNDPITQDFNYFVKNWCGKVISVPPKYLKELNTVPSTSDNRTINNVMRHEYKVLSEDEKDQMSKVKDMGLDFYKYLTSVGDSRELSLAKTKIEEAVMWAVKHITK